MFRFFKQDENVINVSLIKNRFEIIRKIIEPLRVLTIVRVLSLIFLFIVRLRFPSEKSVAEVIRKRYNDNIVKQIRKFEKLDYKIRKNEADTEFLTSCQHNQLTSKFLNFKVASSNLR